MQVVVSREGSATIIKPLGPMVIGELEEIDQSLVELAQKWCKRIIINMSDSTFIDSAGLELLKKHHDQLSSHGLKLKLSGLSEISQKILDITRLTRLFEIYPDTASAVRSYL